MHRGTHPLNGFRERRMSLMQQTPIVLADCARSRTQLSIPHDTYSRIFLEADMTMQNIACMSTRYIMDGAS